MDSFDEKIKEILNAELHIPVRIDRVIQNALNQENNLKRKNVFRVLKPISVVSSVIFVFSSAVFAGYKVYDKIWKEPESYKLVQEVSEEEKVNCITEEEAIEIASLYIDKIGLSEEILTKQLEKEYLSNENIWKISTKEAVINIDAEKGNIKDVSIPTWNYKIPYNYGITTEEAREVAWKLLEKYKLVDDNSEYKMVELRHNMNTDITSYIWYVRFEKIYGDELNPYESVYIGWVPTINGLYCLDIKQDVYEENEVVITKEEAEEIAVQMDKKIEQEKEIETIESDMRIKQMNVESFLREKFKDEYEAGTLFLEKIDKNSYRIKDDVLFYESEDRVRKVWTVQIKYQGVEGKKLKGFTYFVDATTGEIIGGNKSIYVLDFENNRYNDPYNLIKK